MSYYDKIYQDVIKLIKKHGTNNPKTILKERGVQILPFPQATKLLGMYYYFQRVPFVYYNPNLDNRMLRMVHAHELGHDMYHRKYANGNLVEFELFDINSELEMEANIFAAHLLLSENEIRELAKQGYTYSQLASAFNVNVNMMAFKLMEMKRRGENIHFSEKPDRSFFKEIDGTSKTNWNHEYRDL